MCSAHRRHLFSLHPSEPATNSCSETWAGTQTQGLSRARVQSCVRATAQPLHHNPAQHGHVPRVGNGPCPGECCPQYPSRGWDAPCLPGGEQWVTMAPSATQAQARAPGGAGHTVLILEDSLPAQAAPDKRDGGRAGTGLQQFPIRSRPSQCPCLCPDAACPASPQGLPSASISPSPAPQSLPLLSLLAWAQSTHSPSTGSKGCAGGTRSPSGLGTARGGGGRGQHPPVPPQGRWVPGGRCCAGRPWGGSHTSPSSASASGSGA